MITLSITLFILLVSIASIALSIATTICIFVITARTKSIKEDIRFIEKQNKYIIDNIEFLKK